MQCYLGMPQRLQTFIYTNHKQVTVVGGITLLKLLRNEPNSHALNQLFIPMQLKSIYMDIVSITLLKGFIFLSVVH